MRCVWVGVLATVLGCSVSASAQTWSARSGGSQEGSSFAGVAARGKRASASPVDLLLRKRVESVDWDEATFEEVLDWLDDESEGKVNVIPRWNALELEDVNRDRIVTLKLKNVTIAEVLTELLDQLSETGEVTFRGSRNALRISTRQDFNRKLELRIYDVTDILFRNPDFSESAPEIDLQQQTGGAQGGSSGGEPIFRSSGGQSSEELGQEGENDPEKILEDLVTLIQEAVAPETWEEAGGRGRVKGFNKRQLVVLNSVEVHEMIAGYFSLD